MDTSSTTEIPESKYRRKVSCNGCTICCKNDMIFLHPEHGDKKEDYEVEPAINPITEEKGFALKKKKNGDCIYLCENWCSIHDKSPIICQEFDCGDFYRGFIERTSRSERRRLVKCGFISKALLNAGRKQFQRKRIEKD